MTSEREVLVIIMEELTTILKRQNRSPERIQAVLDEWKSEDERVYRCPKCNSDNILEVRRGDGTILMCEDCRTNFTKEEAR